MFKNDKKKLAAWFTELDDADQTLTRDEFMTMMAYHTRTYNHHLLNEFVRLKAAVEHIEVMLTRLEGLVADRAGKYPTPSGMLALAEVAEREV